MSKGRWSIRYSKKNKW